MRRPADAGVVAAVGHLERDAAGFEVLVELRRTSCPPAPRRSMSPVRSSQAFLALGVGVRPAAHRQAPVHQRQPVVGHDDHLHAVRSSFRPLLERRRRRPCRRSAGCCGPVGGERRPSRGFDRLGRGGDRRVRPSALGLRGGARAALPSGSGFTVQRRRPVGREVLLRDRLDVGRRDRLELAERTCSRGSGRRRTAPRPRAATRGSSAVCRPRIERRRGAASWPCPVPPASRPSRRTSATARCSAFSTAVGVLALHDRRVDGEDAGVLEAACASRRRPTASGLSLFTSSRSSRLDRPPPRIVAEQVQRVVVVRLRTPACATPIMTAGSGTRYVDRRPAAPRSAPAPAGMSASTSGPLRDPAVILAAPSPSSWRRRCRRR